MARLSRAAYAQMFGPTAGDKVRLADTELIIEVERDFTAYGEEVKFGGGKVIRDGMGQSQATRAQGAMDLRTLATESFIIPPRDIAPGLHDLIIGQCRAAGFAPRITQHARQMQTVISLVSSGMGFALVPASVRNPRTARPSQPRRKARVSSRLRRSPTSSSRSRLERRTKQV